ncbi:MAG: hypothetical protein JXR59_11315 [Desulfuromonadaceae bacterium]|nr:hypothetical protein [Desulfuromonadaceae bacterium]
MGNKTDWLHGFRNLSAGCERFVCAAVARVKNPAAGRVLLWQEKGQFLSRRNQTRMLNFCWEPVQKILQHVAVPRQDVEFFVQPWCGPDADGIVGKKAGAALVGGIRAVCTS